MNGNPVDGVRALLGILTYESSLGDRLAQFAVAACPIVGLVLFAFGRPGFGLLVIFPTWFLYVLLLRRYSLIVSSGGGFVLMCISLVLAAGIPLAVTWSVQLITGWSQ